ncbi:MAG: uL13 family ribosomal protein [Leptolyngbyaceae cyanobacterium CSU_1_3]|nr:uL13 family ribosomal protein [Leptolyngbyaceae cyanobacterium CSU_1_3]
MTDLTRVSQFIATIEQQNPGKSAYEIANILRGYTKPTYTTQMWTIATGFEQSFLEGTLNQEVILAGEITDFGHLIASLSDQINQPGLRWSDFTKWTADHTAWAGDIGSAIGIYRTSLEKFQNLGEALDRFASNSDYTADVAAYLLGAIVNSNVKISLSNLIQQYDSKPLSEQIRLFIKYRFRETIVGNQLKNPGKIEAEIRSCVFAYLELSRDSSILKEMKKIFTPKLRVESEKKETTIGADILQGSLHFLSFLIQKGNLEPIRFKPYQLPQAPWLGTVSYEVTVGE